MTIVEQTDCVGFFGIGSWWGVRNVRRWRVDFGFHLSLHLEDGLGVTFSGFVVDVRVAGMNWFGRKRRQGTLRDAMVYFLF